MASLWGSQAAREGERIAERNCRLLVLTLARSQGWPALVLQRPGNPDRRIRPTRRAWEEFAETATPRLTVRAIAGLWPDFTPSVDRP